MLNEPMAAFAPLHDTPFLCLTTFRYDSEPVETPLRFAQDGKKLYLTLPMNAGVVRRIRENAQVEVSPCTRQGDLIGDAVEAMAIILADDEWAAARRSLNQKYGWTQRLIDLSNGLRGVQRVYIEITPM